MLVVAAGGRVVSAAADGSVAAVPADAVPPLKTDKTPSATSAPRPAPKRRSPRFGLCCIDTVPAPRVGTNWRWVQLVPPPKGIISPLDAPKGQGRGTLSRNLPVHDGHRLQ